MSRNSLLKKGTKSEVTIKHTIIQTYNHTIIQTYKHTIIQTCNHTNIQSYKSIQSNALYRSVLTTQLTNLASLAKWLSVHLRTKWLWVRVLLQSLKLQISRLFRARSCLTFRQLQSVDSL